ncbi:hypothetical protein BV898_16365 [Hypsibius exemplaris]|uniref:G-protein coupled receptors family 1 profile domain-containing protein n=1 Tax=Hypsibius exemplaris TaxID=2072580 RepID=A0A9X6RL70_HYPEX|nr:hypothetical protein BV898_16365 [Hypsibius exemplaris]
MSNSCSPTLNANTSVHPFHQPPSNRTHNGTLTDASASSLNAPLQWNLMSEYLLFIAVAGVSFNGLAILRFVNDRTLLSPFSIQIIALLVLNFISAITQWTLSAVAILFSARGKWTLGSGTCDLYLFSNAVVSALIMNTHGLLALNRTWAVLHPFSYRRLLSQRRALQIVAGLFALIILGLFPFWLMDAVIYRLPLPVQGCTMNVAAQAAYNVTAALLFYTLPVVVVWVAFIVVVGHKVAKVRRKHLHRVRPVKESADDKATNRPTTQQRGLDAEERQRVKRSRWQSFLVLILLTVSVTVCYGPRIIYAALRLFIPSISHPLFFQVASMLFAWQIVLDPILLSLTIGKFPGNRCIICC